MSIYLSIVALALMQEPKVAVQGLLCKEPCPTCGKTIEVLRFPHGRLITPQPDKLPAKPVATCNNCKCSQCKPVKQVVKTVLKSDCCNAKCSCNPCKCKQPCVCEQKTVCKTKKHKRHKCC